MSEEAMSAPKTKPRASRMLVYLAIAAATLLVVGANAHLLVAALDSQPECVAHLKVGHDQAGAFRAAESSC